MKVKRRELILGYGILAVFTIVTLMPLVQIILTALTPPSEAGPGFAIPSRFEFSNFVTVWNTVDFSHYLFSSVLVTTADVVFTMLLAIPAAFAFARLKFPGANALFLILLVGLMIPEAGFIIPLFFNMRSIGLTDTYWGLILPQTAWSLGFAVFWMRNYFLSVPGSVIEAARLDGASDLKMLWYVLLPPASPAIATACLLVAMWTWNEFLLPLVMISNESMHTAPLALALFQGEHTTDYALLAAAGALVALPIVILYIFLQRHFIAGMLSGAVKG